MAARSNIRDENGRFSWRSVCRAPGALLSTLISGLLWVTVLLFGPTRLGRLVRSVSLPRLRENPLRTNLTVLGVALGVAVLLAVGIVSRSVLQSVHATVDDLAGRADLQVASGSSGFDESLLERVAGVPGVLHLTPGLQQIAPLAGARDRSARLLILGIDMLGKEDGYFRNYGSSELEEIRRDPLEFMNSPWNLIVSREFATRHGYRLRDKIALGTPSGVHEFEIRGFLDSRGVGKAFGGAIAAMYYPAMQVAFGRGQNIDRIDIAVQPGVDVQGVADRVSRALGEGFVVERPALRGERVANMLMSVQAALLLASLISLMSGMFLIYNTMSTSVAQRKQEVGILRALGTTRRELLYLLTLEGALLGTVSAGVGVALGVGLSRGLLRATSRSLNEVYLQVAVQDAPVEPWLAAAAVVLGVLGAALASTLPAYRAGKATVTDALRTSGMLKIKVPGRGLSRGDLLGAGLLVLGVCLVQLPPVHGLPVGAVAATLMLLLAAALLLPRLVQFVHRSLRGLWFGVEANLARENLPRDLGRTSATAATLMAGVGLTIGFATFIESFMTSLEDWSAQVAPGDLFVTSGASVSGLSSKNTPMSDELRAALAAIDGVEEIRRLRSAEIDFQGSPLKIVSSDIKVFAGRSRLSVLEGDEREILAGLERGGATVSENFSRRFGVHRGDRIRLATAEGGRMFDVVGVLVDYTSDIGSILLERRVYAAAWHDERVDTFELFVRPGVDPRAVQRRIEAQLGKQHDLFVLTNRQFRGEFAKATDQIFHVLRALELATLIVAALGIVNALFANVLDRVREIGVLRALGMLRAQIRRMILVEASLLNGIGTFAGVLVGMAIGYVMLTHVMVAQIGWYFPYRFPWRSALELCLVTLPVSVLAGWYPARNAAQLVVTEALDYE